MLLISLLSGLQVLYFFISVLSDNFTAVEVHYKVAKQPSRRRITVEQLQTEYKVIDFLHALEEFLTSCSSSNSVVQSMQIDQSDVYNDLDIFTTLVVSDI